MRKANMNNNQIYPFERNRYYPGKMLTSADFQAEQNYFNNKRRFLNNMMYGAGIICGCGVFSLDDLSLLVESGAAIDGLGREIVIESSVVKKLSSIEGFDQLKTNLASLCLRYQEKDVHTVYALNSQNADKEYEYNRISEEYQLFLMDSVDAGSGFELESEFLVKGTLVETEDYLVEVILPATVCRGRQMRMLAKVQKLSADKKTFSYHGVLQTPAFCSQDGGHEVEIAFEDIALEQGEMVTKEYWMKVQDVSLVDTDVVLKSDSASATVNIKGEQPTEQKTEGGEPLFETRDLCSDAGIKPFDFYIKKGEVNGFTGLLGSGRSECVRAIFGADRVIGGTVKKNGKQVKINKPLDAMRCGIGYLPEDRKRDGIVGDLSVRENIILALQVLRGFFHPISRAEANKFADEYIKLLDIKTASAETPIKSLSGGNQQKVILARWLLTHPEYLILDEPTRGIDVGTKVDIQKLVLKLAGEGMSVTFISSETDEMLRTCSRLVVMRDRKVVGELSGEDLTQTRIMSTIAGGESKHE